MITPLLHEVSAAAAMTGAAGMAQTVLGYAAVRRFARARHEEPACWPAVTVLKPLCGAEPMLDEALESFFRLDYPSLQLVFGVQREDDPAAAVVERLCARYPLVDAVLVRDGTRHGANLKIANLINMFPHAAHDVLLVSDSDMHVAPDYLRHVAAALARPGVGLVTTIYTGLPARGGLTPKLGAAYITQIFASGALMSRLLGRQDCLGATMALTRETLIRIGGFPALSPYVADDGVLGRRVAALGLRVDIAATTPATSVPEADFGALLGHELRWARTIRAMAPVGFTLSALQFPVFWAGLAALCAGGAPWALILLAGAGFLRAVSGRLVEATLRAATTPLWLAPLRDFMSIAVWIAAYTGETVDWRGSRLTTAPDRALNRAQDGFVSPPPKLAHGEG